MKNILMISALGLSAALYSNEQPTDAALVKKPAAQQAQVQDGNNCQNCAEEEDLVALDEDTQDDETNS